jgi:uncharacterized repeat protein (TIGR03803 family)
MLFTPFAQAILLLLMGLALAFAAPPAQAQTETVLYNFTGGSDGSIPQSRLASDGAGNFYGTTCFGGLLGFGTVFEVSPDGVGGWSEIVLYSFTGGSDGANPYFAYVIFDGLGNLYGTTYNGGANGYGVVYELSPAGGSWTEIVLYSFANGAAGANPLNGLIMDSARNLYGRTYEGGNGAIFELTKSGGDWTEQVIYSGVPGYAGLTMDAAGDIFGASNTQVFELSPNRNGGWNQTLIHTFQALLRMASMQKGLPYSIRTEIFIALHSAGAPKMMERCTS